MDREPETAPDGMTRRDFMAAAAQATAGAAVLSLIGCGAPPRDAVRDSRAFFDDGTGFIA
jgi:hypothetical protein